MNTDKTAEEIPKEALADIERTAYDLAAAKWGDYPHAADFMNSKADFEFVLKMQYLKQVQPYYHDIHCNTRRGEPMGCEGCSCYMYQRALKAEKNSRKKTIGFAEWLHDHYKYTGAGYYTKHELHPPRVSIGYTATQLYDGPYQKYLEQAKNKEK